MSDRICVYDFVKQSDIVFTKCKIEPNTITLFNNIVITPILFYELYHNYFFVSLLFVWFRAYLDGLDGYIARKYNKCTQVGEIYDHFSDCLYTGTMTSVLLNKVSMVQPYAISIGYMTAVGCIVCDYDKRFHWIAEFAGAGGNEDGYSFLLPASFVIFTWLLYLSGFIE